MTPRQRLAAPVSRAASALHAAVVSKLFDALMVVMFVALFVALFVVMSVSGCATRPPADAGWTTGRLSVRVDAQADTPARSLSAGFELRGDGQQGELRLSTPLGTLLAAARWSPGEALLTTPGSQTRFADLDALSREALGEALPLQALPDWLAGRPWPGAASRASSAGFDQLGWQINLAAFPEGQIDAVRDAAPRVTLRARLEPPS